MTPIHFRIVLPDGTPVANTLVMIQLARSTFNTVDEGVLMPTEMSFVTDSNGEGNLSLWPSQTLYYLSAEDVATGATVFFKFIVPSVPAGTTARFQDLIVDGASTVDVPDNAYDYNTFIATVNASMQAAHDSQVAAAASAAAAEVEAAAAAAAAAGRTAVAPGRVTLSGKQILRANGQPFIGRGVSDFRWGWSTPDTAAYWASKGADHMRDGLRWFGLYGDEATDSRKDSDPGGIDAAHLAQVVAQKQANFAAGLGQIHVFDSDQGQNGAQDPDELAYGVLPKWPVDAGSPGPWPNGRNVWTDLGLRARYYSALQTYAAAVMAYGNIYEPMPEPGPVAALGITDAQIKEFYAGAMDAILAIDPTAVFIIGASRSYNIKRVESVYFPDRSNIIYTGNLFAFEGQGSQDAMISNAQSRLASLIQFRDKYNVPVWVQQVGVNTAVDPDHKVIKALLKMLNDAAISWSYWEDRGPVTGAYSVRTGPQGTEPVVNEALLSVIRAAFYEPVTSAPTVVPSAPATVKAGYRMLTMTASSTGARANNMYSIGNMSTYSRTNGVVTFECSEFLDADSQRLIKIASPKLPSITALLSIISAAPSPTHPTRTRIVATELYTDTPRPDIAEGTLSVNSVVLHDLQANTNTQAQYAKLNAYFDGAIDITNMSMGGSTVEDWQDEDLRSYIEGMPFFDLAVVNFGYDNDVTDPTRSAAEIIEVFDDNMQWACKRARRVLVLGTAGARLMLGDGTPVPNPAQTVEFTTMMLLNHYMREAIAQRYPNAEFVDVAQRFVAASRLGSVDTDDLVRGEPPVDYVDTNGIHLAPAGNDEYAAAIADAIFGDIELLNTDVVCRPDFVYVNSAPDLGGVMTNPNGLYPWIGAVPTAPVTLDGVGVIGMGIQGTTVSAANLPLHASASLSVVDDVLSGRRMELLILDPSAGGGTYTLEYQGTDAFPIAQLLNDTRFRGVDCALWGDIGVFGFNDKSVFSVDVSLMGTDSTGVTRKLASFYCDDGAFNMTTAQRAWPRGFDGRHRAGNGRIRLPTNRTWTRGFLRMQVVSTPINGYPLGQLVMRLGGLKFSRLQSLITPLPNSFA